MAKITRTKRQTMIYKSLNRKLKTEQPKPTINRGNSDASEG
jgi:hypothetical protein